MESPRGSLLRFDALPLPPSSSAIASSSFAPPSSSSGFVPVIFVLCRHPFLFFDGARVYWYLCTNLYLRGGGGAGVLH